MITVIYLVVDLVTIEFLRWWKWSQCFFKMVDLVTNEFCHQWKWSQWFFWMVDLVTHTFLTFGIGHMIFFSIVTYSILTFFNCDLFHPYKSVYGNNHKNMSNSTVTKKILWLFPPLQKLVWLIPQLAVVTNSICPKGLCQKKVSPGIDWQVYQRLTHIWSIRKSRSMENFPQKTLSGITICNHGK